MQKIILIIFIGILGCNSNKARSNVIGENIVEGIVSQDTVFNGLIKYYNKNTKKLTAEAEYINGQKNGEYKQFNENGSLSVDLFYKNDMENGIAKIYDDKGYIVSEDFYYYGLRSGNALHFKDNLLKSYSFYSLENTELMHFEYDSLRVKQLPDLITNFFFYSSSKHLNRFDDTMSNRTEYFLYTPNPPPIRV
jgi:uncharacterized FlgJ-related protein